MSLRSCGAEDPFPSFQLSGVIALDGVERFFWPVDVLHHTYRVVTEVRNAQDCLVSHALACGLVLK